MDNTHKKLAQHLKTNGHTDLITTDEILIGNIIDFFIENNLKSHVKPKNDVNIFEDEYCGINCDYLDCGIYRRNILGCKDCRFKK